MLQDPILILDISSIFYRAFTAIDYKNSQEEDYSGFVGTIQTIEAQIKRHKPSQIVAVFEGKGGSKKKREIFEGYKAGRKIPIKIQEHLRPEQMQNFRAKSEENFLFQQKCLVSYLAELPMHICIIQNYEADEIIAQLVQKNFSDKNCIIVSGDKDFQQLISPRVNVFHLHDKQLYDEEKMKATWLVDKGYLVTILRIFEGDASDNLPGLYGYGRKTVLKYFPAMKENNVIDLNSFKLYVEHLSTSDEIKEQFKNWKTMRKKCEQVLRGTDTKETDTSCWSILERNWKLMQLQNPDINFEAQMRLEKILQSPLHFNSRKIKELTYQDHIELKSHKFPGWELLWRELLFKNENK